ncbi:MAG: efflux RND transporter periplasmic adaptor subunit [Agarilytica sp.]
MITTLTNKKILPFTLLAFFILLYFAIKATKPSVQRITDNEPPHIEIEVITIQRTAFPIYVESYGIAQSLIHTTLISRVSGTVEHVSERFREGAFFKKGDLLLSLDQSDYQIELDVAKAQVAEAESRFANERALAEEARDDWKRSGRKGEPPALALRLPQLEAAKATLKSAQAGVARAKLNLSRTEIRAPYDGSVLSKSIDLGQYINLNIPVGEIFSTEMAEIRIPINSNELTLLGLNNSTSNAQKGNRVRFDSSISKGTSWQGNIVRITSALDSQNRQIHVIARIGAPFTQKHDKPSLKVGEYLQAKIEGDVLESAISIPLNAVYQGRYVYVFDNGVVNRRNIEILWSDSTHALIAKGLDEGEHLVTTTLGQLASGTAAKILNASSTNTESKKPQNRDNKIELQPEASTPP